VQKIFSFANNSIKSGKRFFDELNSQIKTLIQELKIFSHYNFQNRGGQSLVFSNLKIFATKNKIG